MKTMGKRGHSIIKAFHLFFVSVWAGSWLCLLFLLLFALNGSGTGQILDTTTRIHMAIVIPSVIGSLVTGIIFSGATNWGFFKHHWIIIKYAINIFPILGGALIFAPHLRGMTNIVNTDPTGAIANPIFISDKNVAVLFLALEFVLIGVAIYLSVFKPRLGPRRRMAE